MKLIMITSRDKKFNEAKAIIPFIEQMKLELTEIQSLDYKEIASRKLDEAAKYTKENIMIDDAGVELECLNNFPGPYAKDFIKKLGFQKIAELTEKLGNSKARMICNIGLQYKGEKHFFQGIVEGNIMKPQKQEGFDYDLIFAPKGYERPFAELEHEIKLKESHRTKALEKLAGFLKEKNEL